MDKRTALDCKTRPNDQAPGKTGPNQDKNRFESGIFMDKGENGITVYNWKYDWYAASVYNGALRTTQ